MKKYSVITLNLIVLLSHYSLYTCPCNTASRDNAAFFETENDETQETKVPTNDEEEEL